MDEATGRSKWIRSACGLCFVGLILFTLLRVGWNGLAPRDPWIAAKLDLKMNFKVFDAFYKSQARWPKTHGELKQFSESGGHRFLEFVSPVNAEHLQWIIYSKPHITSDSRGAEVKVIATAPMSGGFMPEHKDKKLSLSDQGEVGWFEIE